MRVKQITIILYLSPILSSGFFSPILAPSVQLSDVRGPPMHFFYSLFPNTLTAIYVQSTNNVSKAYPILQTSGLSSKLSEKWRLILYYCKPPQAKLHI
ncbi:hypothetical protein JCM21531_2066 [Acetivibrio straminisolvens JCM 21531]|uniref:Uncharacterized protein n=1 Tax=Acetivibrio straminisolvens JCM 21531 TaxID=1294263 RepID=W4V600_9FIRM|nr:hypothetical protein JCM21531_2066 [Acetivibrio straminisolvens JCM 21531]